MSMNWKREGIKDEQIGEQILRLGQSERQVRNSVPQLGISKGPNTRLEADAPLVTHRRPLIGCGCCFHSHAVVQSNFRAMPSKSVGREEGGWRWRDAVSSLYNEIPYWVSYPIPPHLNASNGLGYDFNLFLSLQFPWPPRGHRGARHSVAAQLN